MNHEHGALDVHRQGVIDYLFVHLAPGRLVERHVADIVNQDVDLAELRKGGRRDALHVGEAGNVALHHQCLAAHGANCLGNFFGPRP